MEALSGSSAVTLLSQAMQQKRQLHLFIPGTDYTRLTMILKLPAIGKSRYIVMDPVRGLAEPLGSRANPQLVFEFVDAFKIRCRFVTQLHRADERELWVHFPAKITRMQRREHFRVTAPSGSVIRLDQAGRQQSFAVKDISIGGLAFALPSGWSKATNLEEEQTLPDIQLHLVSKDLAIDVNVDASLVRRIQQDPATGVTLFSLQFIDMQAAAERQLSSYILSLERQMIRRQRGLEE